jgi:hypothetical protein
MMRGERVLMPVRRLAFPYGPQYAGFVERLRFQFLEGAIRSGGTMMPTVRGGCAYASQSRVPIWRVGFRH